MLNLKQMIQYKYQQLAYFDHLKGKTTKFSLSIPTKWYYGNLYQLQRFLLAFGVNYQPRLSLEL